MKMNQFEELEKVLQAPPTWSNLKKMTDEELIERHDYRARRGIDSLQYFIDELRHRGQDRQTRAVKKYTGWMTIMTVIITLATLTNLYLVIRGR